MGHHSTPERPPDFARSRRAPGRFGVGGLALGRRLRIPLPPLQEQRKMAGLVQACNSRVAALEGEIQLLEELFRAMLEELMTGRLSGSLLLPVGTEVTTAR